MAAVRVNKAKRKGRTPNVRIGLHKKDNIKGNVRKAKHIN